MMHRLAWLGMAACFTFAACGGSTQPGNTDLHEDGGQDVPSASDPACLAFCAAHDVVCLGADTEYGTGIVTATAKGCSIEVMLVVTGTIDLTVDCTSKSVCVDRAPGDCTGTAGICYPTRELTATGFAYSLPSCIHGSLGCSVRD